jgi:hypothetical protein
MVLEPAEALSEAQRLLDENLPFQAHEILEGTWKAAEAAERPLWQGLAQVAVGLTHIQRGNATGAVALLRRGAERIDPYREQPPYEIDVAGLGAHAVRVADQIEATGMASLAADDVRPRLRGHDAG